MNLPKFTWIYLNLPEFTWIHLNLPEFTWIYLNLPEFTGFYLNLPELTWTYLNTPVLTSIEGYEEIGCWIWDLSQTYTQTRRGFLGCLEILSDLIIVYYVNVSLHCKLFNLSTKSKWCIIYMQSVLYGGQTMVKFVITYHYINA